ncbi:MAG: aldolase/citrate lyase family protein [Chloroflexota bacterium]
MRENNVRKIWAAGGAVLNGWLTLPDAFASEMMAHQGFDSCTVDMQHGPIGYQTAVSMLQAVSTTDVTPMVRVPWNEPGIIGKMLDAGAYGIICPMVNTRAEAEAFVGACRYPPHGYRSHGPNRAMFYAGSDYPKESNNTVITMAMIETKQAVDNLEDILTVPHLDAIYVGPADLSRSLGIGPAVKFHDDPLASAIDTIITAAKKHGIYAGSHCGSPADALHLFGLGFQFATVSADRAYMAARAAEVVAEVKKSKLAEADSSSPY